MSTRWVVITGTSTGIGRAAALALAARGCSVIATVRRQADADDLARAAPSGRLFPILMDVASEASIRAAMPTITSLVGERGLWALVNNAGIVVPGPLEHVTLADWRRQFDVNFFGMVELTRHCLPLLRAGVATHGPRVPRLMFVSSIGGRVAQPINAPYSCSKWATTALGDSMRLELRGQGIGVTVLEPGAIATAIWGKGEAASSDFTPDHPARKHYHREIVGLEAIARRYAAAAIPAERAAAILIRALEAKRAPARVLVGTDAKVGALLRRWLPLSWFDAILIRELGLEQPTPLNTGARP